MVNLTDAYEAVKYIFLNAYYKTIGPHEDLIKTILIGVLAFLVTGHNVISWVRAQTGVDFWQAVKEGGDKEGMIENEFKVRGSWWGGVSWEKGCGRNTPTS